MTIKQLQEWQLGQSLSDQWWVSADRITDEAPMALTEVEEAIGEFGWADVRILHISQDKMEHLPWVQVDFDRSTDKGHQCPHVTLYDDDGVDCHGRWQFSAWAIPPVKHICYEHQLR